MIHSDIRCELGEGPLWHPERGELLWFDILGRRLHGGGRVWDWDAPVSAAGWVDADRLVVASDTGLWLFDLQSGSRELVQEIEAARPETRSNDGKADPWGGFWIGTMGKHGESGLGSVYRWYGGTLHKLHTGLSIPNAICFDRLRSVAYYADTPRGLVFRQPLDPESGMPSGPEEVFLDLSGEGLHPDGATVDAEGRFWNAQWGAGRVACYDPEGRFVRAVALPAGQTSCPSFGGAGLSDLFVTSALEGMSEPDREAEPQGGMTFCIRNVAKGLPEPRVILP